MIGDALDEIALMRLRETRMFLDNRMEEMEAAVTNSGRHPQLTYDLITIMHALSICLEHIADLPRSPKQALRVSDGNRDGEDAQRLRPEGMTARCHEVADAQLSSSKARIETLETALEEIASDVGFLLRAIEDQDPYGELRLRVKDVTKLVRDARSALRSKEEERSPNTDTSS